MAAEKLEIIINAKDQFSKTMKSLRGMLPSIKTLAIGTGAAVSGLGAGLFAIANSTAKAGDELQKMSLRLGLSSEMLSGMKHAVELSGASMQDLEKGVRTLAKRMSDADEGLVEAERSFEALGIQVKNADGSLRNLDTMMAEAAEGLANMEDNTKRVALAQELFGRSGTALLPLFKQGAEGLRKMTEEARALGITFDKAGADQAAEFKDNMLRLQRVFTGIKTQIGQAIIPAMSDFGAALQEVGKELVSVIKDNKDEIQNFATGFLNVMSYLAQGVGSGVALMIDSWNQLRACWYALQKSYADVMGAIWKGIDLLDEKLRSLPDWRKLIDPDALGPGTQALITFGGIAEKTAEAETNLKEQGKKLTEQFRELSEASDRALKSLIDQPSALGKVTDAFSLFRGLVRQIAEEGASPFTDESTEKAKENIETITNYSMEGIYATRTALVKMQMDIDAAVEESTHNFEKQMELHKTLADETARALQRNFSNLFFDVFTGDLKTIDGYFKAFTQSMLKAFSDMIAQMLVKWAIMQAAMSFGGFGGLGFLGGLFHEGGVVGQTNVPMRFIPMPRLHGGLRPDEYPAILQRGETVLPKSEAPQGAIVVEKLYVHNEILPNAGNVEAMLQMSKKDWEDICEDKILPAFRKLALAGITT